MWSSFHSQWLLVNIVNRIWSHFTLSQQLYLVRWITPQKYLFLSVEHRPSCDWLVQMLSVLYMPTLQGDKPCAVNLSYVSESEVTYKPLTQQRFCKTFMVWKSDTCPVQAIGAFSVPHTKHTGLTACTPAIATAYASLKKSKMQKAHDMG